MWWWDEHLRKIKIMLLLNNSKANTQITEKKVNPTYFWSKIDDLVKKSTLDENLIKFRPGTKGNEQVLIKKPHSMPNFDQKFIVKFWSKNKSD